MANPRQPHKRKLPKGQEWLTSRSKELHLKSSSNGVCYGVAGSGLVAILDQKVDRFDAGLFAINDIPIKQFASAVAQNRLTRLPENPILAEAVDGLHYIEFCHSPARYLSKFPEPIRKKIFRQNIVSTLPQIIPDSLKAVGGIAYCGLAAIDIFNKKRLTFILGQLEILVDNSNLQTPIAFFIETLKHVFVIGYSRQNQYWEFIDANDLPSKKIPVTSVLAQEIITAAFAKDICIIYFSAFCQGNEKIQIVNLLAEWKEIIENNNTDKIDDLNFKSESGDTLLHLLCEQGNAEKVAQLINRGANLNWQNKNGHTALRVAIAARHFDSARLLLMCGANPNLGADDDTPYHRAIRENLFELQILMLQKNADPNIRLAKNDTPLHIAIREKKWGIVTLLLANKADVNVWNDADESPLMMAAKKGRLALVKELLQAGAGPHEKNRHGNTAFFTALEKGHFNIAVECFKDYPSKDILGFYSSKVLFWLLEKYVPDNNHIRFMLEELLQDIDVNQPLQPDDITLLSYAAKKNSKAIRFLVELGALVNLANPSGRTPLQEAIRDDYDDSVEELLALKTNPNLPSKILGKKNNPAQNIFPLEVAVKTGIHVIVLNLLKAGANPLSILDSEFQKLLQEAKEVNPEIAMWLNFNARLYKEIPHEENASKRFFAISYLFEVINEKLAQPNFLKGSNSSSSTSSSCSDSRSDSRSDSCSDSDSENKDLAFLTENIIINLIDEFIAFDKLISATKKLAVTCFKDDVILASDLSSLQNEFENLYDDFSKCNEANSKLLYDNLTKLKDGINELKQESIAKLRVIIQEISTLNAYKEMHAYAKKLSESANSTAADKGVAHLAYLDILTELETPKQFHRWLNDLREFIFEFTPQLAPRPMYGLFTATSLYDTTCFRLFTNLRKEVDEIMESKQYFSREFGKK